ncbi:MAG: GH36-type glycosyl hydrolase domain-containing protein, partial [Longimicrobiales bacterium]
AGAGEPLRFFNGHGGFSRDGSEYVIRVPCDADGAHLPPQPWVNVVANEHGGLFVSERGAAHTWSVNSRENRITPWFNDPVTDPHGEAFYVRDDATGAFHSLTPGPAPAVGVYHVRHGFGYTRFDFANDDVAHELTLFMAPDEALRMARVAVTNRSAQPRTLSVHAYAQLVLGVEPAATRGCVEVEHDDATGALLARNAERGPYSARVALAAAVAADATLHVSADRMAFLGAGGDTSDPAGLHASVVDGNVDVVDPCAALQLTFRLAPGERAHCAFLLGEADDAGAARALVYRYADVASVDEALSSARAYWRTLLGGVVVETPVPELDLVVNGWLSYQNLSCRMWGRAAFYQSGGAFGFRDQLQDSVALLYLDPALARCQIVLHAEHQFDAGDVLHWWHPPTSRGMRTRFADDLLWLPHVTAFYLRSTGDGSVLDESARFLVARSLAEGEDEALLTPEDSGTSGTVFEHCCRSIDRSLTRGAHGLPLIGVGDWNDGMNRVGREGRGESVWLGFFLYDILHDFIPLCAHRGEHEREVRYRAYHRELERALNEGGWDGEWYRRAYYDDGTPLGAAANAECRIDTIAQAWAVLSGAAPEDRARHALDAMEQHLVAEDDGIIRLLTPAFDRTPHDPGYIKGYLPGVRENGGQYTHGALWGVRALAHAGRRERAAHLLAMLSPVRRGGSEAAIATYRVEPYVIAADVYGVEPHVGRGGWTWYTGSAGWMFRVALESVLGFSLNGGDEILLRPCVPADWPAFRIRYRLPDGATSYDLDVVQTTDMHETRATLDGVALTVRAGAVVIPLVRDGALHHVWIDLGADVGPRYVPRPA